MDTIKEKIRRYTSGKFSINDYLAVSNYFKTVEHEGELKRNMEADWDETISAVHANHRLGSILDSIHHQINLQGERKVNLFLHSYRVFSRIAAIFLLPTLLTISILIYLISDRPTSYTTWAEIHSPVGSRTKFQLPDGTNGWLNSGSSIRYSLDFANNREVEMHGEAWFDVTHIENSDFRIITPFFDVKVLGTQFNVIAYDEEPTAEVILVEGKVSFVDRDEKIKGELVPDQHMIYDKKTSRIYLEKIDSKSYSNWTEGILVFKNEPMWLIAKRLERKYNAEIILHGDSLKNSIFRATFQDENLDEICKLLATVAPIKYKVHKRIKLQDNTFTKNKVEMWLIKNK